MASSRPNRPLTVAPSPMNPIDSGGQAVMETTTERFWLNVEVKQAYDLPTVGLRKKGRKYYVSVLVDGIVKMTRRIKSSKHFGLVWNEQLLFENILSSSSMKLEVYANRSMHHDECVGNISGTVLDVISRTESDPMIFLHHPSSASARVEILVSKFSDASERIGNVARVARDRTEAAIPSRLPDIATTVSMLGEASQSAADIANIWEPLIEKLSAFTKLVDTVSEIHPYAKMAWSIISAVNKELVAQVERDNKVKSLLITVHDMYRFLKDADALRDVEIHKKTFVALAKQTLECAYFISSYFQSPEFGSRIWENIFSKNDGIIDQYLANFEKIKDSLQQGQSLHIDIVVTQMMTNVEDIGKDIILNDMAYARGASLDSLKQCLPNTRDNLITEITEWILNTHSAQHILLLTGTAGTGKSSIVHTIARRFQLDNRLGSCFCFSRVYQAERTADIMFMNIAQDLAALDPQFQASLYQNTRSRAARASTDIVAQFENFVLKPLSDLQLVGPILIVIDALDECSPGQHFKVLLSIIADRMRELPSNIRVLISSRPEYDILDYFRNNPSVEWRTVNTSVPAVLQFIKSQLQPAHSSFRFNDIQCIQLSELSQGLFQWASVVCITLTETKRGGKTIDDIYNTFMSSFKTQRSHNVLTDLYQSILSNNFDTKDPKVMSNFQLILGIMLTLYEPISKRSLIQLVAATQLNDVDLVSSVINSMGALLSGVHEDSTKIKPLHSSFHDFLTDRTHSNMFYIDTSIPHANIAIETLRIMNNELHFNTCQLSTSSIYNSEIPDISTHISEHLSYACQYWAFHLTNAKPTPEVMKEVKVMMVFFMYNNLLFWLEVLSVLKQTSSGGRMLSLLVIWSMKHQPEIMQFMRDAGRFVRTFGSIISQSAPHIYISALPFTPINSLFRKQYISQFSNTLQFVIGQDLTWPALQNEIRGHTESVTSVAFSPDGRFIASGSWDKTVRIWDSETGDSVHEPFIGHENSVTSISFSANGKYIASGSSDKTVRVWDVNNGNTIFGPWEGHTDRVNSVSFASNGKWVVSGSEDTAIKLWNIYDGLVELFDGHGHTGSVYAVVFSPDCKTIASGSNDKTIKIWNTDTGKMIQKPLIGHTNEVSSVCFSFDGSKLASGSVDKSVRVWDPATGTLIAGPFFGHSHWIYSVSFSPDGTKVVSGSHDKTVRVWDALTGEVVAGPFVEHSDWVRSVTFSPDGTRIASGYDDGTIRVWDAEILETDSAPYNGHTGGINSAVVSPDGRLIASGSDDTTIRIWDARTGNLIYGPFEGHNEHIWSVAFSPDSTQLVSGSRDKTIRIWDVATGNPIREPLYGHTNQVNSVAFSPDGTKIVSGSEDKTIRLWNAETGAALMQPVENHTDRIFSVAFSPDGSKIASGSDNKTVRIWNAVTGAPISEPFEGHSDLVISVVFSPNGLHIASGSVDYTIRVWDVTTGQTIAGPFNGHTDLVRSVAFSPDGQWIVSGSDDRTVRVWNTRTGEIVAGPFGGHANYINSVAFYPDGQKILSGSQDQTIRIWDLDPNCHYLLSKERLNDISEAPSGKSLTNLFIFEEDGWVKTPNLELLFWIPPLHRAGFYSPHNLLVISKKFTKLNLDKFKHGTSWAECYTPQSSI